MYCVELEEIDPFYEGAGHRNIQSLPVLGMLHSKPTSERRVNVSHLQDTTYWELRLQ